MRALITYVVLGLLLLLQPRMLWAQADDEDTTTTRTGRFLNNIFQQAVNSVYRASGNDSGNNYLRGRSEQQYMRYQGRIIRHIYIVPLNFDRDFHDTSRRDDNLATRLGNTFHRSTREFVVRQNLFIRENTQLNAFRVADNERYIRSLDYVNDVRFVIRPVRGVRDSVDVVVYTKDLFSIGGGASSNGLNHIQGQLYDANFLGMAQRIEITGLYDYNRTPPWTYGGYYTKHNVAHTFVDASVGHSAMYVNPYTGTEESTDFVSFTRPLVSPYSHMAGGLSLSAHRAWNVYGMNDTLFYRYTYRMLDVWAGYNLAINKLTETNNNIRDRRFLALRYYNRSFSDVPNQIGEQFNPVYNSSSAVLGQVTFFRQDYYKTQYIYGFGTTEDLPYGYNISFTGGLHRQLQLQRPYLGVSMSQYVATPQGDFIQFRMRSGGYLHNKRMEDGGFLLGVTAYSRVVFWGHTRIRQYINLSYTELRNRVTSQPLYINNYFGLRGFLSDSVLGGRRLSLQLETPFYIRPRLLGFRFAPFPYGDISLITPEHSNFSKTSLYTSLGGGLRARNENLIFETIEARAFFFPVSPSDMKGFKIIINSNIRFRYKSNFITAPDVVQFNSE